MPKRAFASVDDRLQPRSTARWTRGTHLGHILLRRRSRQALWTRCRLGRCLRAVRGATKTRRYGAASWAREEVSSWQPDSSYSDREDLRVGEEDEQADASSQIYAIATWAESALKGNHCLRPTHGAELTPDCETSETPLLAVLGAGVAATEVLLLENSPALSARVFRALASGMACETAVGSVMSKHRRSSEEGVPLLD